MTIKRKTQAERFRRPKLLAALLLLAALALTGCGLKGPLVHPAQAPANDASSSVPASAASI